MAGRLLTKRRPVSAGATSRPSRTCWSSSAYPARKIPTRGLGSHLSQIERTSANLRLFLNWPRKERVEARARAKLHALATMIAHDTREKTERMTRTVFAVQPAER